MKDFARTAAIAVAALLALADGATAQSGGTRSPTRGHDQRAAPTDTAARRMPQQPAGARRTHTISGGDVVPSFVGWTDGNVMAHLIKGDSLEIALGELALDRSTNEQIRQLARTVVREHSSRLRAERRLTTAEQLTPRLHRSDRSMDHLVMAFKELHPLSGAEFDRAWLRHQIAFHADYLAALGSLKKTARDDELDDWVDASYAPVRRHLERLNAVAKTMNVQPGVITPRP